jgi:kynurenine 3-monooxygenase
VETRYLFGADGAFSSVRQRLQKTDRFNYQQHYLPHGYKELSIPATDDGGFRIEKNALHIWPRKDFMMIALPNLDGTFTCTLFMAFEGGENSFAALKTDDDVMRFFEREFPDAIPLMPTLLEDWNENPTSSLVTVRCSPYHHGDQVMILGDAAHAIVPFYGQGMNAAFEDCFLIDQLVEKHAPSWGRIGEEFSATRKDDADAIADLALYNFVEMRDKVANPAFLWRKKIEKVLHKIAPKWWIPLYTMVTFSNMPYAEAKSRAARQDRLLTLGLIVLALVVSLAFATLLAIFGPFGAACSG